MLSLVKKSVGAVLSTLLLFSQGANAQQRQNGERIRVLEQRVQQLEDIISNIHQRVSNLEYNRRPDPYPEPAMQESACMLVDTGYNKVFLGKGRLRLEAEAEVRQACSKVVHASYCQGAIKCNDPRTDRPSNTAMCVLIDTGYSKTFKGEGKTLIEAEYRARKSCGDNVHSSYCVGAIRCEAL